MSKIDLPFQPEQLQLLQQCLQQSDARQLAWLSGYCWALSAQQGNATQEIAQNLSPNQTALQAEPLKVTVLSASQTGNAKGVADQLAQALQAVGIEVQRKNAGDYKAKQIADETLLLLVSSTQGDGEPPEEAVSLYKYLFGKKAPQLAQLSFAVLGLGDSSYPDFCQAGKDFDRRLTELGATPLLERVDCDLDFNEQAEQWIAQVVTLCQQKQGQTQRLKAVNVSNETVATTQVSPYNKQNPFTATLSVNQKITSRQAEKDVRHLEIDLAGSGLQYQAGDALGVWFENDPNLVAEVLQAVQLNGDEQVSINNVPVTLRQALISQLELTQNTTVFVKKYAELSQHNALQDLVADSQKLNDYVQQTPLIGVLQHYPTALTGEQLVSLLRPLTPRLYSIASAQAEVGEEVHLTVGVVRYQYDDKARTGGASGYLADRVEEDGEVKVFIEPNTHFRLPQDNSKPIIMIGSGTGIAPFRAFIQQRIAEEAEGQNWLIFGNQRSTDDFLYQLEWQEAAKQGYLHKYSFAWSREQQEKVYVQHKILQEATALWQWLQQGAYIYVCGDASKMAKDVENALIQAVAQAGAMSLEQAEDYIEQLREDKRYQRDVY